jgi:transposase InsO family protein
VLHTDNGGEFAVAEFASYCVDEGVERHYSMSYSPQQNDIIERRNQTVMGMAWALLKQRGMTAVFPQIFLPQESLYSISNHILIQKIN